MSRNWRITQSPPTSSLVKNAHSGSVRSFRSSGRTDIVGPSWTEVVAVRGRQNPQVSMLAFIDVETRIPLDHPLRTIKYLVDEVVTALGCQMSGRGAAQSPRRYRSR